MRGAFFWGWLLLVVLAAACAPASGPVSPTAAAALGPTTSAPPPPSPGSPGAPAASPSPASASSPIPVPSAVAAASPTSAAAAPTPIPITIGFASPSASFWPIYMALDGGYFTTYGLDAKLVQLAGPAMVPALLNHEIDAMDLAAGALIPAVAAGANIHLLVSDSNVTVFGLIATSDIQSVQDLKGKTAAISSRGQSDDFLFRRILSMNGLVPDQDVRFVQSGGTPESFAVLQSGQAVAAMMSPPTMFQALDQGFHVALKPADLFPYQGSGIEMSTQTLQTPEGEEVARRLVHAEVDAIQRIHADKAFAEQVLQTHVGGTNPSVADSTWSWVVPGMPLDGYPTREGLQLVLDDIQAANPTSQPLTVDDLLDLTYLDDIKAADSAPPG